ncbi:hypothetical protein ACFQ1S_08240, partial [Kibdelosporangium lantanae]
MPRRRVRIDLSAEDRFAVDMADPTGAAVASVTSLVVRPISTDKLVAVRNNALFRTEWAPVPAGVPDVVPWPVLDLEQPDLTAVAGSDVVVLR